MFCIHDYVCSFIHITVLKDIWTKGAKHYYIGKLYHVRGTALFDTTIYSLKDGEELNDEVKLYNILI